MGTTWLFNVLQRMIGASNFPIKVVADGVPRPSRDWRGAVLIKSHRADSPTLIRRFEARLNIFGLVMMRDPEATLASLIRTQDVDRTELIGWLESDVQSYAEALPVMEYGVVIREEWVATEAPNIVQSLDRMLGLGLTLSEQQAIAKEFDRDHVRAQVADLETKGQWNGNFHNFDRRTQWHAGHIGPDGPRTVELTPEEQLRVDELRKHIDSLTQEFHLWSHHPTFENRKFEGIPMDFVRAREKHAIRALPLRDRLVSMAHRLFGSDTHE